MEDFDYNLIMYPYNNSTLYINPDWEWRVFNANGKKVTLAISRDPEGYEEFYMKLYTSEGPVDYYTKNLSNCDNNTVRIEFEDTSRFRIKARVVNDNSSYTINAYQNTLSDEYQDGQLWALIVVCIAIAIIVTMTVSLLAVVCLWCKRYSLQIVTEYEFSHHERVARKQYIVRCLNNMK